MPEPAHGTGICVGISLTWHVGLVSSLILHYNGAYTLASSLASGSVHPDRHWRDDGREQEGGREGREGRGGKEEGGRERREGRGGEEDKGREEGSRGGKGEEGRK